MDRRPLVGALVLACTAALVAPQGATADPGSSTELQPTESPTESVDAKRARAAAIQAEIDANERRISTLAEELNRAQYRLDEIDVELAETEARITEAEVEVERRHEVLGRRAASVYKHVGSTGALSILDLSDPQERNAHAKYSGAAAASDAKLVAELITARDELDGLRRTQATAREEAARERDGFAANTAAIRKANADQLALLEGIDADIRQILDEERARREAELALLAPPAPDPTGTGAVGTSPAPPGAPGVPAPVAPPSQPSPPPATPGEPAPPAPAPTSGRGQIAVDYAYAQLGKPYCALPDPRLGPGCFDCSGLTYRAWEAAGVIMPTYSGGQYQAFPKVSLSALAPGDLVFYGPGGSRHVGIFIGSGQMIHAPTTGDVVRIAPIYRMSESPVGAVRPG